MYRTFVAHGCVSIVVVGNRRRAMRVARVNVWRGLRAGRKPHDPCQRGQQTKVDDEGAACAAAQRGEGSGAGRVKRGQRGISAAIQHDAGDGLASYGAASVRRPGSIR
ncbi:hypothetical protein RR42_m1894 [Cupriavidus basilensis]|uniref:Uncharacterized protein n=1 Tax=Cupriavidus basilensis TaxID=68895 RepID=A0A0C4YAL1_9BURK|nr:hypothetical protein RR42_m1894 [Cupriavidus basilensis]